MRVCHIVPSLEERHGGPSKSARALANAQARSGLAVNLLATLEEGQRMLPLGSDAATVDVFPRVAPRWLCRSPELRRQAGGKPTDVVHHHALWLLTLHYAHEAAARQGVPLVISPRGMMSGWAWRHRRWRKQFAELFVHPGAFDAAAGWHATSAEEADDIHRLGFRQPVCVSPNGVVAPSPAELAAARESWHGLLPATRSRPVAVFYSRLHRKKRVRELIDLWLAAPRGDWLLLVAGSAEESTPAELAAEVATRGASDRVLVADGADRPPPYAIASLFVLPSHSENFGLVIAEALAAGVPALVTDTTPWSGLAAAGAGWCVPWPAYAGTLATALAVSPDELRAMGSRGQAWLARDYSWDRAAGLLQTFYQDLSHARR
jgi:glycosyltransferase involved in cell wall biosynthesis